MQVSRAMLSDKQTDYRYMSTSNKIVDVFIYKFIDERKNYRGCNKRRTFILG